jgi:selenocysteine lyase/cysteine desulfurase
MRYEKYPLGSQEIRDEFPIRRNLIWLHHAGVSPLCLAAASAMKALADDAADWASFHYSSWLDAYEGFRVAAAKLIGASPREIAIVKNTSEGIATVQMGLDWKPGDRVVAFREEFPANYYPWKLLEERAVKVEWLSIYAPLESIEAACKGARLLAISHVNYLTGHRVDLQQIGSICKREGTFFLVDAIQGLGVFPIDVEAMHIDALSADGHKWLMGPEGCGVLYVRKSRQDEVRPVEFGWTNVAGFNDYGSRDMTLREDAGRYECGTLNTIGVYGLRAAMEFVLEIGVESIGARVLENVQTLAEWLIAHGYELSRPWKRETSSGIVSFRHTSHTPEEIVARLRAGNAIAAVRQGWVRLSPHFYQNSEEMNSVLRLISS